MATLSLSRDKLFFCGKCPVGILRILLKVSAWNVKRTYGQERGQRYYQPRLKPRRKTASSAAVMPQSGELKGCCYIIDGDTIVIKRTKIRLAGIDAPELGQPWGQKAKWAMIELCKGQTVTAKLTGEVSYDRLVATCFLPDGRDIGAELIKQGLALDGNYFTNGKYRHLEPDGARRKLMWARSRN